MASIEKISIALPREMVVAVREAVDAGEYASTSEIVREALRDWTHKRNLRARGLEDLRRIWKQATDDNSPGVSPDEVFTRLEQKYQAMADAAGDKRECA